MKITYKQKPDKERLNSFWYDGECAVLEHNGRKVMIIAVGEIRIDGEHTVVHDGCKERGDGVDGGMNTDADLQKIDDEKYTWVYNNWFDLHWLDGDTWEFDISWIAHNYDEAISTAIHMLTDKETIEQLWDCEVASV